MLCKILVSAHYACPFGATASVYAWERIGQLIRWIARKYLKMVVFTFVDDSFALERIDSLQHGMGCFARLVRALLGPSAIAADKLECGRSLVVLGVQLHLKPEGNIAFLVYLIMNQ